MEFKWADYYHRRKAHSFDEESQGIAQRVDREGVSVDELPLRDDDAGRIDELRAGAKEKYNLIVWLGEFKNRFDAFPQLHKDVQWDDVEKSLKADPESMTRIMKFDSHGHDVNVFGEKNGELIFASGWEDYNEVSLGHRNISHHIEGQKTYSAGHTGDAVSIIAELMGVTEEEAFDYLAHPDTHRQLKEATKVKGWAWLRTDVDTRNDGHAHAGDHSVVSVRRADHHGRDGSFRIEVKVKKV